MQLQYETVGNGPPLLFVSGWSQPGRRWLRFAEKLADRYTCVMPDNRECGRTGPSPTPFTLTDLGHDLLGLMAELGHERFHVVGVSMGGMISQEVVRAAPERVVAAVLVSTHGGTPTSVLPPDPMVVMPVGTTPYEIGFNLWSRLAGPGFAEAHPDVIAEEARVNAEFPTSMEGVLRQLDAIRQFDPGDALVGTPVPILVVHGDSDPLIPYENGVRLAEKLGVELVTLPGVGHGVPFERPEELTELIGRFFSRTAEVGEQRVSQPGH
ncbi:MAG TPA: alpha/beta hydrolase [Acidimicrobiales bacterium]|nr:alpha/beta hydrolase [Acidimicrobiales bacterium]